MVHGPPGRRKSQGNNATNNHDVEEDTMPLPPDGGWGWVVVFGSFMIHIVTDGMTYSFGLFYEEFLTYFNEGSGYTAWVASIMVGVTFASGPISSSFVNRYGCRAVTIAGSFIAAGFTIISIFAQNVLTLIITIGFGTGLGFGLIYLPAIVSVTQYFDSKRSLATGIAVCGSGFGTFVFAPLTQHLIGSYGWRGAMLIIGGVVLNCIIFGAMFRPLEAPPQPRKNTSANISKKGSIIDQNTTQAELEPLKSACGNKQTEQYLQLPVRNDNIGLCRSNSVGHNLKISLNNNSSSVNGVANGQMATPGTVTTTPPTTPTTTMTATTMMPPMTMVTKSNSSEDMARVYTSQPHLAPLRDIHRERSASGTMYRPDALYQGSLHNIPEYVSSRHDLSGSGTMKRYGSLRQNHQLAQSQELTKCCGCITCSKETRDTFDEMMNFSLFKDPIFIVFTLSNFCTSIGFNMPYLYVVPLAKTLEISSLQASYLISTIGVANTVGRIILGYISDKPWVNRLFIYNTCLTACGIATAMAPLCYDFNTLAFYCAVFGFTIGAYVGLTSVILVDLLGLDKLTNAFGLLLLFQGIASFIGPPIGGWMFDVTQSYSPAFLLAGITIAISGIVMFIIPPLQRYKERKTNGKQTSEQFALS